MLNCSDAVRIVASNLFLRCTLSGHMATNNMAVAALGKRLSEAEKNVRLLSVEVKKIRMELNRLHGNNSTDAFNGDSKPSTPSKRDYSDYMAESASGKKLKQDFTFEKDYAIAYTDGACPNNGRKGAKAGIGVWWGEDHHLNVSKPTHTRHTNNAAEIQACTEACRVAAENGVSKLLIKTDSDFVIKCMTEWIHKWKKNNWKTANGKDVINKDDLVDLEKQSKFLTDLKYEHVRGHSGIEGNEGADRLAVQGAGMKLF